MTPFWKIRSLIKLQIHSYIKGTEIGPTETQHQLAYYYVAKKQWCSTRKNSPSKMHRMGILINEINLIEKSIKLKYLAVTVL